VLGVLVVLILLVVDGLWAAGITAGKLERTRSELQAAADALLDGDVDAAIKGFEQAKRDAEGAGSLTSHPAGFLADAMPWVGDDVDAVQALAEAARLSADAGLTLANAARRVGFTGQGLTGASDTGGPADVLSQISPELQTAAAQLHEAADTLNAVPTDGLISIVADAVAQARGVVAGRATLVGKASDVGRLVEALYRPDRRLLLIVQNPGEPRGTGGFWGYFGILEPIDGKLELTRFFPAPTHARVPAVKASAEFKKRWKRFDALRDMRQVNFTSDLPTALTVGLRILKARGLGRFDGAIVVDPIWMQYILEQTGPVSVESWPAPLTADNVIDVLGRQLPAMPDEESNTIQGQIGRAIWEAFQTRDVSATGFATALARAAAERHLMVWSKDPDEEAIIRELGASGEALLGPNPLSVQWVNLVPNKAAILQDRRTSVDVTLDADGTAHVTTELTLDNHAAAGPASSLLGSGDAGYPIGTFADEVSIFMPANVVEDYPVFEASRDTVTGVEEEFGHKVAFGFVWAPAGESTTWSVAYTAPKAVTQVEGQDGVFEYRVDYLPQPAFTPIPVKLTVYLPEGAAVTERSPQLTGGGRKLVWADDAPVTPASVWVRFSLG
jgi:Protein of unknown function (DUF4012)